MQSTIIQLVNFIKRTEKLKTELRHSWLSDPDRQESVAEHSWMMALIAMSVFDEIGMKVDQLKVMKLVTIHDLAEAIIGDIPSFATEQRVGKYEKERAAMQTILKGLPPATAEEFMSLWEEMEAAQTPEAKLAQSLDKLEVLIQHLIADISTWDDNDYSIMPYYKEELFDFNPYMRELKDYINEGVWQKVENEGDISRIPKEHIELREQLNKNSKP